MKLAIADPPYLGRADRWYGNGRGSGRLLATAGRPARKPDFHPQAKEWDRVEKHMALIQDLSEKYDGFSVAGTVESGALLFASCPRGTRLAAWVRTNSMPAGARVINTWESVLVYIPKDRRNRVAGNSVRDCLVTAKPTGNFLGRKPAEWTNWVLRMMGFDPSSDTVDDLFPGSGSVGLAISDASKP